MVLPSLLTRDDWRAALHADLPRAARRRRRVRARGAAAGRRAGGDRRRMRRRRSRSGRASSPRCSASTTASAGTAAPWRTSSASPSTALESDVDTDRGAVRMLEQTRFLVAAFRRYEARLADRGLLDEHGLDRRRAGGALVPLHARDRRRRRSRRRRVRALAVGLRPADAHRRARRASRWWPPRPCSAPGSCERLRRWLPEHDEVAAVAVRHAGGARAHRAGRGRRRVLAGARSGGGTGRRSRATSSGPTGSSPDVPLSRTAVVFKRPLPYVYLARQIFSSAGVPQPDLRRAARSPPNRMPRPSTWSSTRSTRASRGSALIGAPPLAAVRRTARAAARSRSAALARLDRKLSEARYLAEPAELGRFAREWPSPGDLQRAAQAAAEVARRTRVALGRRPAHGASRHGHRASSTPTSAGRGGRRTSSSATSECGRPCSRRLTRLRDAHAPLRRRASGLRRRRPPACTGGSSSRPSRRATATPASSCSMPTPRASASSTRCTWSASRSRSGPRAPRRASSIRPPCSRTFTGPRTPTCGRRSAPGSRTCCTRRPRQVRVSTITLEHDSLVEPSPFLDDLARGGLVDRAGVPRRRGAHLRGRGHAARPAAARRARGARPRRGSRSASRARRRTIRASTGRATPRRPARYRVSTIDQYLACPFVYFSTQVLRLAEEPEDEEALGPRAQGTLVHEVLQAFFEAWQARGGGAITMANLDDARALFAAVAEARLAALPETDAGPSAHAPARLARRRRLRRHRPLGRGGARPRACRSSSGCWSSRSTARRRSARGDAARTVRLAAKADRIDLLEDGTFRVFDYKLSRAPNLKHVAQLPAYPIGKTLLNESRIAAFERRRAAPTARESA